MLPQHVVHSPDDFFVRVKFRQTNQVCRRHFLPLAWPQKTIAGAPVPAFPSHLATALC